MTCKAFAVADQHRHWCSTDEASQVCFASAQTLTRVGVLRYSVKNACTMAPAPVPAMAASWLTKLGSRLGQGDLHATKLSVHAAAAAAYRARSGDGSQGDLPSRSWTDGQHVLCTRQQQAGGQLPPRQQPRHQLCHWRRPAQQLWQAAGRPGSPDATAGRCVGAWAAGT